MIDTLLNSLSSPMVLAFVLGVFATIIRSDLKLPEGMYLGLTVYLLFAIGIKGGVKLTHTPFVEFYQSGLIAILMCLLIPIYAYQILKRIAGFDSINAAAMAAHFGSVSVVTFSQTIVHMETNQIPFEGFVSALLAIMEVPGIMVALYLAKRNQPGEAETLNTQQEILKELLTGKGFVLLIGGLLIGLASGDKGFEQVNAFFDAPFKGVLCLFLLEVGLVTGRRLSDLKKVGFRLISAAIAIPIINAFIGIWLASLIGLNVGTATIFGVLCASASYIAAPAAVRIAIPEANPGYYLTAALAVAFPFNVTLGIPLYHYFATLLCH
jgi:hypothetical protein